ncbi:TolC family protein [Archangium violaceum]|uniref:Transporter n=1 Tax=Archangium violaceum Cb vi76 TaxID=1406225 RepID=A0A084SZ36_9BACT|nr:TolC family protein [Archangium violaceum]KFA93721.1 transporter [Archangium violaceum Cb vi76]
MHLIRSAVVVPVCAWLALCVPEVRAQEQQSVPGPGAGTPSSGQSEPTREPLTLERAVSLAAERNETALTAQARAEAAEARVARARAFFFPRLNASATYTRRLQDVVRQVGGEEVVVQARNAFSGNATATVPLFDARGFPLLQAASRDREATALDAVEARRQVSFQAANAFLSTLGLQQVAQAAERRLVYARQSLEDAKARAQAGLASTNDVTRAQLDVATAEANLADAVGQAETSRLELGYLLVAPVEGPLAAPETLLGEASRPVESFSLLTEGALERRPDILSAKLRVRQQEALASEPLARLFPTLSATGVYSLTNEAGLAGRNWNAFVSVNLGWSLFDGGERYADRRERLALVRVQQLDVAARTRRVDVAVDQANVLLRTAQAALNQSQVAADAARQNAEETSILYRQGIASSLALSDAQVRQFEAEVALARARYALGSALLELRIAVGLDPLGKEP